MPAYGLTTTANAAKTARAAVTRWNDRVNRHTIYTVCGTGADGWGLYNDPGTPEAQAKQLNLAKAVSGNNALTLPADGTPLPDWGVSFDAALGRSLPAARWNWVPVSYPASAWGLTPSDLENAWNVPLSIADSVAVGVAELTALIRATPGTFALAGMSQGAVVISQVLRALQTGGSLSSRLKDCIGAVAFGNPCRKPGPGFPGMTDPGDGGMLAYVTGTPNALGLANVTLPSWWMELAVPGDFFACAPVTGPAREVVTALAGSIIAAKGADTTQASLLSILRAAFVGAGAPVLGTLLQGAASVVFRSGNDNAFTTVRSWLAAQHAFGVLNPHVLYGTAKPVTRPTGVAGLTANSTYLQVAVAYLTARGNAVAPR